MPLVTKAGQLLRKLGQLATSCGCCLSYWCVPSREDACGQQRYDCANTQNPPPESTGPHSSSNCGNACPDAEVSCEKYWCYATGYSPCGGVVAQCTVDAFGDEATSGPFDYPSCDGCGGGGTSECPADKWYCCYDEAPSQSPESPLPSHSCTFGPCAGMMAGDYSLYRSGPHDTSQECNSQCGNYSCTSQQGCVSDPEGPHASLEACQAACGCLAPTAFVCSDTPTTVTYTGGGGFSSRQYSVSAERLTITLTYHAADVPDRFQIWGPTLNAAGATIATRVIKADSGYRGGAGQCVPVDGAGDGSLTWVKAKGITCFEVTVISPCEETTYWEYTLTCGGNPAP